MRRVISLWLPKLAIDRLRRRNALRPDRKSAAKPSPELLVTVASAAGRVLVEAVDPAAQASGLAPGMPLADARALEPGLTVVEADPAADRRVLDALAAWCGRYTPSVATGAGILPG